MALTSLSAALQTLLVLQGRIGAGTANSALISDLVDGDFLLGPRAYVVGTPTVSGTNRVITLKRRDMPNYTVTWNAADTVWIIR